MLYHVVMIICKKCEKEKSEDEFYKAKNTKTGRRGSCIDCTKKQNAEWYDENKDELRPVRQRYAQNHREEATDRMRKWRKENPDLASEQSRIQYERNKDVILERSRENHASKPGYAGWKSSRRRARIKENGGTFTYQELIDLFSYYDNKCINPNCDQEDSRLTPDHVVPLASGGTNDIHNIQPLCLTCNLKKGTKTIDYRERYDPEV